MTSVDSLDEPTLAELYFYWADLRRGRFAPARSDIDPLDIPHLLPYIALSEVVPGEGGRRIRYRLAGTQIEAHFGCSLTNRYLDELKHGGYLLYVAALYERLITQKIPVYDEARFGAAETALSVKRLMLPLSSDAVSVTMVLSGLVYQNSDPSYRTTVLHAQTQFSSARQDAG